MNAFQRTLAQATLTLMLGVVAMGMVLGKENPAPGKDAAPTTPTADASAGRAPIETALFKVNDHEFTAQDYATFLQSNPALISKAGSSAEGKAAAIKELASLYLLQQAMIKEKLLPEKPLQKPSQNELIAAYEKLADKYFPIPPVPDEKAVYKYYQEHQNDYGIPEMVRLNQIQFTVPEGASDAVKQQARGKAEAALKRLNSGEKFENVAEQATENKLARITKGDIGFLDRNEKAWMREGLKGKKVGERTDIIETPTSFEILQITDIRPALITPYANIRDEVIKNMRHVEQKVLRDSYVKELAKTARIEVLLPDLKVLFPNGIIP